MKKIWAILLTIIMATSLSLSAFAVDKIVNFGFETETTTVEAGADLTIDVTSIPTGEACEISAILSGHINVPEGFTINKISSGLLSWNKNANRTDINYNTDLNEIYFANTNGYDAYPDDYVLFTIELTAPTENGKYTFTFGDGVNFTDWDYVKYTVANGGIGFNTLTVTVGEEEPAGTSIEVLDAEGINEGYTANDFTVSDTLAQFTLFAKATNAAEYGIILSTEEFTKANIKEKNVWILAADDANEDGIFAVTAFEEKAADASFKKLTSASVWACAYAIDDAGEYVISNIIEY